MVCVCWILKSNRKHTNTIINGFEMKHTQCNEVFSRHRYIIAIATCVCVSMFTFMRRISLLLFHLFKNLATKSTKKDQSTSSTVTWICFLDYITSTTEKNVPKNKYRHKRKNVKKNETNTVTVCIYFDKLYKHK